jgi:mono/diheme cytochrome c family protein
VGIRITLFVCSLLLLGVVCLAVVDALSESWQDHQSGYYDEALDRAESEALKEAIQASSLEIKQDQVMNFGKEKRVDRCRSCHSAIDDPGFVDGVEPLRTHPKMKEHPFNLFGCTICHEGQGRSLTKENAHGEGHHWPEPLLDKPYIESSCARCHARPWPKEMSHLARGDDLFERTGCVGCHLVKGLSRGTLGPELTDVGNRFRIDYLTESVEDPAANSALTQMPKFNLPEQDVVDIVTFLKSLRGRPIIEDPVSRMRRILTWKDAKPALVAVTAAVGKKAIANRGCKSCHKIDGEDGELAPDLTFLGLVREAAYIVDHLSDPRKHTPDSNMPNFWLAESEKKAIAAYLTSQKTLDLPAGPADQYKLLCGRCHGDDGDGNGVAASNLVPRPRVFTNAKFFNWLPEERAHLAILEGLPGTAMPTFKKILTEKQAQDLFAWIRKEFLKSEMSERAVPRDLPSTNPTAYSAESAGRGHATFLKRCIGCHGRLGDGKGPSAPEMLPRPRNLTNTHFLKGADDSRLFESITFGIVGTGMPPWDYLTEDQRWDLVNFVRSISKTGAAAEKGK